MKKILYFTTLIFFLSIANSFAQEIQNKPPKKIAFVIESLFFDQKLGIKDVSALSRFESKNTANQNETDNNPKRYEGVYNPAKENLSELLKQIENKQNLVIIKINEGDANNQIIAIDVKFDITKKIISFINDKSAKSVESFKLDLPETKIGIIDTRLFLDNEKGIKQVTKNLSKYNNFQELCSKTKICIEIGGAIQNFALKKGFSIVFDSSKELPAGLDDFPKIDITQDFIADFN